MSGKLPRSYLYVPADASSVLPKAAASEADALIIDLEDAVLPARKQHARAVLRDWLGSVGTIGKQTWIRVNPGDQLFPDLESIADAPGVEGIVVAKATVESLRIVGAWLDDAHSDLRISPLIETAQSVLDARLIAEMPRVAQLQLGEVDLAADLGLRVPTAPEALAHARSLAVLASAAAGITSPVGPVSVEVRDLVTFEASTRHLRSMGFVGRACIHPAQVSVVNAVYTPTVEEVDESRAMLEDFAAAQAAGSGVVLGRDGRLIDEALLRSARRTVRLAEARPGSREHEREAR